MFQNYIAIVFGKDGLYRTVPEEGTIKEANARKLKNFTVGIHKYKWDATHVSRLCGWYPWQMPTFNPFKFLWQWLERRFVSVGVILYREPEDDLKSGVNSPDEVLLGPMTFDNLVIKGYDRVSPALFRGAIKSKLYTRYQKKANFGKGVSSKLVMYLVIGVVVVIILLSVTGVIDFRGNSKP
jgi:hypothetical protein